MTPEGAELLPAPRWVESTGGSFRPAVGGAVVLDVDDPAALLAASRRYLPLRSRSWALTASAHLPAGDVRVVVRIEPGATGHGQGFRLETGDSSALLVADDRAGARYGLACLGQLLSGPPVDQPSLRIVDWPDLERRGYMLDISRDKVPTTATLHELVGLLADLRFNELQLYTEHTFAYRHHREVWAEASPVTPEEVLDLDAHAASLGVELVPNQNSFGHMERWFAHERYRELAEKPDGFRTDFGVRYPHGASLNPLDPRSLAFVRGLHDELLPNFSSWRFNVGLDETFDLGLGASAAACRERGRGQVYLEFLQEVAAEVTGRGLDMQFWADIVNDHPELLEQLPAGVVALDWWYEAETSFAEHAARFDRAGLAFRCCPGTSGWNSVGGRVDNALPNIAAAVDVAAGSGGAEGILLTDWGDNGHWQPLPVSLPGLVAAGAWSWGREANTDLDLPAAVDRLVGDASGRFGSALDELGRVYRRTGLETPNSTPLFWMLRLREEQVPGLLEWTSPAPSPETAVAALHETEEALVGIDADVAGSAPTRLGGERCVEELRWAVHALRAATWRGRAVLGGDSEARRRLHAERDDVLAGFERVWLARNREGGLRDSRRKLARAFPTVE